MEESASFVQLLGACGFGALIGWYVYYVNRYRTGQVQLGDLTTVIGVLGGGSVLALFPAKSVLFGAYGVGLFLGFFGYFATLCVLVSISPNFTTDWFLDGRRKKPTGEFEVPGGTRSTSTAMAREQEPPIV